MSKLFVSYRRTDSGDICDRLATQLRHHFGDNAVFRDVNTILAGADFPTLIFQALEDSRVVLVVIGPAWATIADAHGRRLSQPDDYVRREIEQAIRLGKTIVPVLVHGARIPARDELPAALAPLTDYVPVVLRPNPWFLTDLAALERRLHPFVRWQPASWLVTGLSLYTLVGYGILLLSTAVALPSAVLFSFTDPIFLCGAMLAACTMLWAKAADQGLWWWNAIAVLLIIPFVPLLVGPGLMLGDVASFSDALLLPLAGLAGTAAGLFGPRGRQATDALQVRLPGLSILTLSSSLTLGLSVLVAAISLYVPPGPNADGIAGLALVSSIGLGVLATLTGGICGIIRAALVERWGWFTGLFIGMLAALAVYASTLVPALVTVTGLLIFLVPLVYCVCLMLWSTGQVSRVAQRALASSEVHS